MSRGDESVFTKAEKLQLIEFAMIVYQSKIYQFNS
jgi:hypothetical protein